MWGIGAIGAMVEGMEEGMEGGMEGGMPPRILPGGILGAP